MRIGRMRRRVTIELKGEEVNALREPTEVWAFWIKLWAEVEDLRGREYLLAKQVEAGEVTTRVRIRYRDDLDRAKMRIVDGSRTLSIESILEPEGRRRKLELMCKEVDDGTAT